MSENDEFCIKNEELCINNEELCIKNDEFRRPATIGSCRSLNQIYVDNNRLTGAFARYLREDGFYSEKGWISYQLMWIATAYLTGLPDITPLIDLALIRASNNSLAFLEDDFVQGLANLTVLELRRNYYRQFLTQL